MRRIFLEFFVCIRLPTSFCEQTALDIEAISTSFIFKNADIMKLYIDYIDFLYHTLSIVCQNKNVELEKV